MIMRAAVQGGFCMEVGFYAGSFDPFTKGHLHVLRKTSRV